MQDHSRWIWVLVMLISLVPLLAACGRQGAPGPSASGSDATTEEPTYRYNQLLSRDSIRPIYTPEFVPAAEANLDDEQLVLGVALDGEAKAYPISVLNSREMVNDELAGTPILATW